MPVCWKEEGEGRKGETERGFENTKRNRKERGSNWEKKNTRDWQLGGVG